MENSKIEWTRHTFNPWWGCTEVSAACDFCYARQLAIRVGKGHLWKGARMRNTEKVWAGPRKWNAAAKKAGERHRVFCASMADVADNQVPDEWKADLGMEVDATTDLDWLFLSKRPQNYEKTLAVMFPGRPGPPPNVWLGMTGENGVEYRRRWEHLRRIPAVVHFVSGEPLFEAYRLDTVPGANTPDWFIAGGEDKVRVGRFTTEEQFRWQRDHCRDLGVKFFMKQMTGKTPIPADLMVREFPVARAA